MKKNDGTSKSIESLFLNEIVYRMPGYVFWKNRQYVYLGCNENLVKAAGMKSQEDFIGKTDYELPWSANALAFQQDDERVMNSGEEKLNIEETFVHTNGKISIVLTNKVPLKNEQGEVIGIIAISSDISERKRMEQELTAAKETAESANRAKTEFIANMSHDIRTPLTGVIGISEILEHTLKNPEEQKKAHLLHDSGKELLHMLNDILDDVQAEHFHERDVKKNSFDLHECIHELVRMESPATALKQLEFKEHIAPNVPRYICSDRSKIQRILLNLLGNAIKFTQKGSISLEIDCFYVNDTKAHLKFAVSDTGIGIAEEAQAQVFNRFFKVSSSYKGLYNGHGLGLHIVQSYVTLLGGTITLTSKEGVGSTFVFDLECELGTAPLEDPLNFLAPKQLVEQKTAFHLLLVEDNDIALKTLEYFLSQKGYTFSSATTGEAALTLFHERSFDLIITDIGLPGISGNELSKFIRAHSPIPIIALTGHAEGAAKEECLNSGINIVHSKPAQIEVLHEDIQQLMQKISPPLKNDTPAPHPLKTPLGLDLPDTEEELFHLDHFPLFDEALGLKQLGDKALLISLLQTYLSDEMQCDVILLKKYYAQTDWENLEKTAHKIKGGVAYIGVQKMRYACQYLERYYKAGHRSLLDGLYYQIIKVNEETIKELTQWLQQNT